MWFHDAVSMVSDLTQPPQHNIVCSHRLSHPVRCTSWCWSSGQHQGQFGICPLEQVLIPEDPEKPRTTQCFCTPTLVFHDPNTKQIFSWMVLVLNLFILHTKDPLNTNSNGLFAKCMGYYTTHTYIYDMLPVCRCQLGKPLSVPGHSQHGSCGPCSQEKTN